MLNRVRVDGEKYLYRDNISNAIINTNKNQYITINQQELEKKRIATLEEELKNVKSLLQEMLSKEQNK